MITLYSGTPGSGKSFHAAKDVYKRFQIGGGLIANFPVKRPEGIKPKSELRVSYWDNSEITPQRLTQYALTYHEMGKEGQTLLIVDEAQVVWNAREFQSKGRQDWIAFFSQHRKLGFNILLIAQNDRMLDRQIRFVIENEVRHRKLDNYGFGGRFVKLITGNRTWFIAIEYWYGGNKLKLNSEVFPFSKKFADIYDSYRMFDDLEGNNSLLAGDPAGSAPALRLETVNPARKKYKTFKKRTPAHGEGGAAAPPQQGPGPMAVVSAGSGQ